MQKVQNFKLDQPECLLRRQIVEQPQKVVQVLLCSLSEDALFITKCILFSQEEAMFYCLPIPYKSEAMAAACLANLLCLVEKPDLTVSLADERKLESV